MSTPPETEISTERLLLRPLTASDAAAIQRLAGDQRVSRYTAHIPHPYPAGAAETFIAETQAKEARGEVRVFAVAMADAPGDLIGVVILDDLGCAGVEIGYWLGVPYWGRGLMSEAVGAAAAHGRAWRPGAAVLARTFPENVGSQRVLEKAGFRPNGVGACDAPARGRLVEDAPLFVFEPAILGVAEPGR